MLPAVAERLGWFVEAYYGRPVFVTQPASRTNDAGTTATFSVLAGGSEPLSFQWLKDGVPLVDGGNITGAATAVLMLTQCAARATLAATASW